MKFNKKVMKEKRNKERAEVFLNAKVEVEVEVEEESVNVRQKSRVKGQ